MSVKIEKEDLSYLTEDFQHRLILQILSDRKFATSIIDILEPNYFKEVYLKKIVAEIKNAYEKYEAIPDLGSIKTRLFEKLSSEVEKNFYLTHLKKIEESSLNDTFYVQETATKFCKRQELKKAIKECEGIINNGDLDKYEQCESIIRKALDKGDISDNTINVLHNIASVLEEDFRNPISTGIEGLDKIMNGGLAKGELAVILAAFGVGKTTMFTKLANSAFNQGQKVLQIFFEDTPKVIQRKHLACWTGINLSELSQHKEEVQDFINNLGDDSNLKLKKMDSTNTTMSTIKTYVRKLISSGFKPDLILIDYIDCIKPSQKVDDVNVGEGMVMRELESMLYEFDIAAWTAVQGSRNAINATIVESDQMGGSIKKGQIAHFILSIAKSLEQKEAGTANIAILKSRFGKDGMVFEDVVFNNGTIQIEIEGKSSNSVTITQARDNKKSKAQSKINDILDAKLRERAL